MLSVKQLALFGAVLGLVFGTGAVSYGDAFADGGPKADICYKGKDKEVKLKDVPKYLAKGATLGECDDDDDDDDKKGHGKGRFKHVLRGDGPPPEKLGKIGDLYFDTDTKPSNACMDFYVKISKHNWEKRGTVCDQAELEIAWTQLTGIPPGFADGVDDVDDADADPENELQDLGISGRDLSLSGSSIVIPLPFALDDQSCPDGEAIVGIDDNGAIECDAVSGEVTLTFETIDGSTENLGTEGTTGVQTLSCNEGSLFGDDEAFITGFNIIVDTENAAPVISSLSISGDTATFEIINPSADIDVETEVDIEVPVDTDNDGQFDDFEADTLTVSFTIPGFSINVQPQIICAGLTS